MKDRPSPARKPARPPAPGKKTPARSAHATAPQAVRIIGGTWRRTRLAVADRPGLRPTPDRVRETLFNWLASLAGQGGGLLAGWACVDAFAGTGVLGLEAASRGAEAVLVVEQDAELVRRLREAVASLGAAAVRVERGDGVAALRRLPAGSQHVVFLDPPFDQEALLAPALAAGRQVLRPGGVLYLESGRAWSAQELAAAGFEALRHLRAGAVHAHLLRPVGGLHNARDPAPTAASGASK